MQLLAIHRGDAGVKIDMQLTGIKRTLRDNAARLRIRKTPERRANAREQLLDRKGLGQVVVGAPASSARILSASSLRAETTIIGMPDHARTDSTTLTPSISGQAQIEQHDARCLR